MSPRSSAAAMGRFSRSTRPTRLQRRRRGRPLPRRAGLRAERLESRAMLTTVATLSTDLSPYTRIPVTFRRPDGSVGFSNTAFVGQLGWSGMSGAAAAAGVPASFKSFCIDGLQFVAAGRATTFPTFSPALATAPLGGAPAIGVSRASLLESFWRQYGPATAAGFADKTDAAAFQLAVWEIINDATATGTRLTADLTSGQFSVGAAGRTLPAYQRAQQWLAGCDATAPARSSVVLYTLQSPTAQDQIVAVPTVDLDIDSDNTGAISRSAAEEGLEEQSGRPGVLVPVGGERVPMVVEVPSGQAATLEIIKGADRVAVWTAAANGQRILSHQAPSNVFTASTTLWIEAIAPSVELADVAFKLSVSGGPGLQASSDTVHATTVAVDLDLDTNNDGVIDPDNGPTGTDDPVEEAPGRGLVVPVSAGRSFVPLKVSVNYAAAVAWRQPVTVVGIPSPELPGLTFTFTFSDAGLGPAPAGAFRIWTKDASFARTDQDRVASGRPVSAADLLPLAPPGDMLGATLTHGEFTLYLEVVTATDAFLPITVRLGGAAAWAAATTADVVQARGFTPTLDLDVDSNNDDGFGHPERSEWEEKLEDHDYGLGKLVRQSSPDPYEATSSASLAEHFTPLVVAMPKNLPVDAKTIGVVFRLTGSTPASGGDIRIWTRDKGPGLQDIDAAGELRDGQRQTGHRIEIGSRYTLGQVNYDPATGEAVLYMDGRRATNRVTLNDVELMNRGTLGLKATLSFSGLGEQENLANDAVKYIVVREDFFYSDFQERPEVRSALASRGVYEFADMPNFSLKRLTEAELGDVFASVTQAAGSHATALLYADKNPQAFPGFKAVLYQDFAAKEDKTYVLAFAGTDDATTAILAGRGYDWVENVWQACGVDSFQYQHAMIIAQAIEQAVLGRAAGSLTTTGHSLGGGLASAASIAVGAEGITFNAAGLHENTLRKFLQDPIELDDALKRYYASNGLITAFHVDFDFLTILQTLASVAGFPTAIGKSWTLDGPYDRAVAAGVVATIALPGLTALAGVAKLTDAEIRSHLMNAVLWGLLVDEGVFAPNRDLLGYDSSGF